MKNKNKEELSYRIMILQQALSTVSAGAHPKLVEWHVTHIKRILPNDEEILVAADLLIECIKFTDTC